MARQVQQQCLSIPTADKHLQPHAHALSLFPFCFLEFYSILHKILAVSSQNYIADKE